MKKLINLSFLLMGFLTSAQAQIAGNAVASQNNNWVNPGSTQAGMVDLTLAVQQSNFSKLYEANVMMNVKASAYVAIFSLTQFAESVEEAEIAMQHRLRIFENELAKTQIFASAIFVDPISMMPTYETEIIDKKLSKTFNEVPTGFEMKKNVHIRFQNHDQINEIISTAAKAEVYDLVKVDYFISNKDSVLQVLRQEALEILLQKKKVFEEAGVFTRISNIGEMNSTAYPAERYAQYYAYKSGTAPYQIVAKKSKKPQTIEYNYADKQKTIYYDKVSEKQFDKIINPVVDEPMVQVYFSMKANFYIYDPEEEKENKAYNAKIKELQLKEKELDVELKKKELLAPYRPPAKPTTK